MVKNNKKILIATGLYPPDVGGPATYSKFLFDELPKHGFEVVVVSYGEVRNLPKIIRHALYFFKIIKKGRYVDYIFAQDPVSVGLPAFLAARVLRKRFLLKVVGDYAWEQYIRGKKNTETLVSPVAFQQEKYGLLTEMRRKTEHLVARGAEKIIVPSVYLKGIVASWGIDEKKISVVYNSVRKVEGGGNKKTLRGLLQFKGTLAISAGRLVPWKGFQALITIVPRLVKRFPDFKLLIIGSGPEIKKLENLIAQYNLEEKVVLTGPLAQDVLLRYIKAADIFILNTFYEGLSHMLLEVMAVGTPIVTTSVGGNPELLQNKKHALLVPYNDKKALEKAILGILHDRGLADKMVAEAQKRVEEFSEQKMIAETIKILQ